MFPSALGGFWLVREVHRVPVEALGLVLALLRLEHKVVEVLLEPLVRVVDEQLLEGVDREDLEAEDVQQADGRAFRLAVFRRVARRLEGDVAAVHEVVEERAVQRLEQRVARARGRLVAKP